MNFKTIHEYEDFNKKNLTKYEDFLDNKIDKLFTKAYENKDIEILEWLVNIEPNIIETSEFRKCFNNACELGKIDLVKLLLKLNPEILVSFFPNIPIGKNLKNNENEEESLELIKLCLDNTETYKILTAALKYKRYKIAYYIYNTQRDIEIYLTGDMPLETILWLYGKNIKLCPWNITTQHLFSKTNIITDNPSLFTNSIFNSNLELTLWLYDNYNVLEEFVEIRYLHYTAQGNNTIEDRIKLFKIIIEKINKDEEIIIKKNNITNDKCMENDSEIQEHYECFSSNLLKTIEQAFINNNLEYLDFLICFTQQLVNYKIDYLKLYQKIIVEGDNIQIQTLEYLVKLCPLLYPIDYKYFLTNNNYINTDLLIWIIELNYEKLKGNSELINTIWNNLYEYRNYNGYKTNNYMEGNKKVILYLIKKRLICDDKILFGLFSEYCKNDEYADYVKWFITEVPYLNYCINTEFIIENIYESYNNFQILKYLLSTRKKLITDKIFHYCCIYNNILSKWLLKTKPDIKTITTYKWFGREEKVDTLMESSINGHLEICDWLISINQDFKVTPEYLFNVVIFIIHNYNNWSSKMENNYLVNIDIILGYIKVKDLQDAKSNEGVINKNNINILLDTIFDKIGYNKVSNKIVWYLLKEYNYLVKFIDLDKFYTLLINGLYDNYCGKISSFCSCDILLLLVNNNISIDLETLNKIFVHLGMSNHFNSAEGLFELYPDIDISYNNDELFFDCCENENEEIINWLMEIKPDYYYYNRTAYVDDSDSEDSEYNSDEDIEYGIIQKLHYNKEIKYVETINECTICLNSNSNIISKCNHQFCETCIVKWYEKHNCCPLCKQDLSGYIYAIKMK